MNKEIKIRSSYIPDESIDINEWCKIFKVGSRVDKYKGQDRSGFLNSQYNFQKLFESTEKLSFIDRLKSLKLVNLW
jgi:hypothetical protein